MSVTITLVAHNDIVYKFHGSKKHFLHFVYFKIEGLDLTFFFFTFFIIFQAML